MKNLEEIIGEKFGKLTVIKRVEKPKHIKSKFFIYYLCKCDCGTEKIVFRNSLINGHTKSCGCYRGFKDLTGYRFGRLLIVKRVNNTSHGKAQFLCKCDCGNEKIITSANLIKGSTISCGCYHKEINCLPDGVSALNSIYSSYKQGSKIRNLVFSLSKEKFIEIITRDCFYCGEKPSNIQKNKNNTGNFIYSGIDRIDNNKGYTENNVVSCCWKCNNAKSKMNIDEFYEWIDKIYKYKSKKEV